MQAKGRENYHGVDCAEPEHGRNYQSVRKPHEGAFLQAYCTKEIGRAAHGREMEGIVMGLFEQYLDGCDDAPTLELEIGQLDSFSEVYHDAKSNDEELYNLTGDDSNPFRYWLFRFIRDVWDIAYSYGEHDALIGEGVPLSEIVAEEE